MLHVSRIHGFHCKGSATWAIDIKNGLLEIVISVN